MQLLSDLHLETEVFEPQPAPDANLLVLAGDIDSGWDGLAKFAHWPVPVLMVAGNHEFDRRELDEAWPALRARCDALGIRLLQRESCVLQVGAGRRIRFVGATRWSDFNVFGEHQRERSMRAARYYVDVMRATRGGAVFDAVAVRDEGLACRAWLEAELARSAADWDSTVVITHFAPSLRSADPRYGQQPGTASFCNGDDDLLPRANIWLHGHLHCRHDYWVCTTRVVSNARGHSKRGEALDYDPLRCVDV